MVKPRSKQMSLLLVTVATFLSLSVWFSTNAVSTALETDKSIGESSMAVLTIAVQVGFVFGTLFISFTNLSDRINARTLFTVSSILAAITNFLVVPLDSPEALIVTRFATGAFLGGVYPMGMKVGTLVGAVTLGSGTPHILMSVFSENWQMVILVSSILAITGGVILKVFVGDGPHDVVGAKFNPRYLISALSQRGPRLALIGYLGHQWELYAMWAWIGSFMFYVLEERSLFGDGIQLASVITFLVFAVGAVASSLAGAWSEKIGRTAVATIAMVISGCVALFVGFIPVEWSVLIVIFVLIWGASVIADSAQFSTAITELSDPVYRGTMLTFQTGVGFALTAISIWLLPVVKDLSGWGWAFAILALGPVVGITAMLRLRSLPESRNLAGGKR